MISLRELFESKINYFVRYNKKNDYTFYTFLKKKCKIQIIKDLYLDRKWFIDHISLIFLSIPLAPSMPNSFLLTQIGH